MAIDTTNGLKKAAGNATSAATPQPTPPPTAEQARSTSFGRTNYGANAFDKASSLTPGHKLNAGLKVNADDPAMATLLEKGLRADDTVLNSQLREISNKNVPDAFGMDKARMRQASSHSAIAPKVPGAASPVTRGEGPDKP